MKGGYLEKRFCKQGEHKKLLFVLSNYIQQVFPKSRAKATTKQHFGRTAVIILLEFPFLLQCFVTSQCWRWVGACMWIVAPLVAASLSATVTSAPAPGRVRETPLLLLLACLSGDCPSRSWKSGNSVHFLKNHIDREKLHIKAAVID